MAGDDERDAPDNEPTEPAAPPLATNTLKPGALVVGKYEVVKLLGAGGMGAVFAARHVELGMLAAIKVMHGENVDETSVARFLREGKTVATLKSAHAVRIHDIGRLPNGLPFLVMEHLEGEDLGRVLLARGPLPIAMAIKCILQVCEVLAEAHAAGIVHRDIKPQNIFLLRGDDDDPRVKVLDFGVAKVLTEVAKRTTMQRTAEHDVLGSPSFMSPEQIESSRSVDARTDIWAVGATFYKLLAGTQPFAGKTVHEVLAKVMISAPPPLRELRPEVSPELEAVVLRCLQKLAAARYASIGDLAAAIRAARDAAPVTGPASVAPVRAPAREPRYVSIAVVLGLIAIGGIIVWRSGAIDTRPSPPLPEVAASNIATPIASPAPLPQSPAPPPAFSANQPLLDPGARPSAMASASARSPRKPPKRVTPAESVTAALLEPPVEIAAPQPPKPKPRPSSCPPGEKHVMGECIKL